MIQGLSDARRARFAILGFASFQACVISLLYMGSNCSFSLGNLELERGELLFSLLFMVCTLAACAFAPNSARARLLSAPVIIASSLLMVAGSLAEELLGTHDGTLLALEGLLVGAPSGLVFAAWGRALGGFEIEQSVPCALIGSALGAAVCFLLGSKALPSEAELFICFLPLVSLAFLLALQRIGASLPKSKDAAIKSDKPKKNRFTRRLLLGTLLFGLATGIMQTYGSDPGMDATPTLPVTLVLFILFCLAALQLFGGEGAKPAPKDAPRPEGGMLAAISRGVAFVQGGDAGPLGGTYRLSGLLLMGGFLFVEVLGDIGVPGEAVAMSGFLSLIVVMVSLFLVMGKIDGGDAAVTFGRGFAALILGEFMGLVVGNFFDIAFFGSAASHLMCALAGLCALIAYLYLFTERDFSALSQVAITLDRFDATCRKISKQAGLSPREAEVLPLALKGRTGERIASELCISKSTVDTHLRRIYAKCGVHNRQELIDFAESHS